MFSGDLVEESGMGNNKQIADTILSQLGGRRFMAMTGARNLVAIDSGLTMKVGRNDKGVTHVTITLTPADEYDMRFQRVWGTKVTEKGGYEGIYCDMLQSLFTEGTGLDTHL